ncbi:GNAT family N-acetyltransferase, partial [Pseudomonas syringae pv. tagetis]
MIVGWMLVELWFFVIFVNERLVYQVVLSVFVYPDKHREVIVSLLMAVVELVDRVSCSGLLFVPSSL